MRVILCALALSLGIVGSGYADIPLNTQINHTFDGATINSGNYFNTAGSETKFVNTAGTGITLNAGSLVRGYETQNGAYTGNGGNIHIQAPDQVVRLNGNIDVRGIRFDSAINGGVNGGNGGNVTIDASYLFQNGNIWASGGNGGNVTMNVGGMTMNGVIDARGGVLPNLTYGRGGNVAINSTGLVDIKGSILTSGVADSNISNSTYGNNIVIIGHGVNTSGTLWASGGAITVSSTGTDADVNIAQTTLAQADGGSIIVSSQHDINQNGTLLNNSHATVPGVITLTAANAINNTGRLQADGSNLGGNITLAANNISNSGVIRSIGTSKGGNITFTGANPTGSGVVVTMGNVPGSLGTITAPDPINSSNTLIGVWKKSP